MEKVHIAAEDTAPSRGCKSHSKNNNLKRRDEFRWKRMLGGGVVQQEKTREL